MIKRIKKFISILIYVLDNKLHKYFSFIDGPTIDSHNGNYEWIYNNLNNKNIDLSQKAFIEIGSYNALDTIHILQRFNFEKAVIFEPSRAGIKRTIRNIEKNKEISSKILFFPFALGSYIGETHFFEPLDKGYKLDKSPNYASSSIYKSQESNLHKYKVPIFNLDSILKNLKIDPFLIIMDAEDSELEILKGATTTLGKVEYICLETGYNTQRVNTNAKDIADFLTNQDFDLIDNDWPNANSNELPIDNGEHKVFCLLFKKNSKN
jgi:FkbM family methyltransferase